MSNKLPLICIGEIVYRSMSVAKYINVGQRKTGYIPEYINYIILRLR